MLYKVTPMMPPPPAEKPKAREPGLPRKRRKSAVYDADGQEVLVSLMCLKCKGLKPLAQFGLRKMADGAIRNQPWCRTCRSGAGTKKPKAEEAKLAVAEAPTLQVVPDVVAETVPVFEAAPEMEAARVEVSTQASPEPGSDMPFVALEA